MRIKKFESFDTKENAEDIFEEFIEQCKLKGWVVSKHTIYGHNLIPIYFAEFESQKQIWYSISDNRIEIFFIKTDFVNYEISEDDCESIYSNFSNINKRMKKFGFDVTEPIWMNMDSFYSEEMGRGDIEGEYLYFEY